MKTKATPKKETHKEPLATPVYEVWVEKPMSVFSYSWWPDYKKVGVFGTAVDARFFANHLRIVKGKSVRITKSGRIGIPLVEGDPYPQP